MPSRTMTHDLTPIDATQREIIAALLVAPVFDAAAEIERRWCSATSRRASA